jgi:transcriptional antiterminator RfaH
VKHRVYAAAEIRPAPITGIAMHATQLKAGYIGPGRFTGASRRCPTISPELPSSPERIEMPAQWFVARTKTGREVTASVSVAGKGYPVFLPVQLVRRSHARKVEQVSKPLFPRYLFIRFDLANDTHGEINWCRGVANRGLIVNADNKPISIPDPVIDRIRDRERTMLAKAGEATTGYQPGETFKIPVGIFASFVATYLGEEKGIVFATVEVFGRAHIQKFAFEDVPLSPRAIDNFAA